MLRKAKQSSNTLNTPTPERPTRRSFPCVSLSPSASSNGYRSPSSSPIPRRKTSTDRRKNSRYHLGRLHFLPDQDDDDIDPTEQVSLHDFFMAASSGKMKTVLKYLDDGGDVNAVDSCKRTALHRASLYEQPAVVALLIERGAKVNTADKLSNTPLHWACRGSNLEVIQTLLANNAKVNKKDQLQNAPLHVATRVGFIDCVNYLLECGAKINEKDCEGDTPIHDAIRLGRPKVVKALILHGADMEVKNMEKKTAVDMIQAWFNNTKEAIISAERERKRKGIDKEQLIRELEEREFPNCPETAVSADEGEEHRVENESYKNSLSIPKCTSAKSTSTSKENEKNIPQRVLPEISIEEENASSAAQFSRLVSVEDALSNEEQRGLTKMEKAFPLMQENLLRSRVVGTNRAKFNESP